MSAPIVDVELGPGVRAAFTSAFGAGGAGPPDGVPDGGFNLGLGLGEDDAVVMARRAELARWAGVPVAYTRQVHGAHVHVAEGPPGPGEAVVAVADGLVTSSRDVALAVLVADCVPVLLADPAARVVATAHAGRAGVRTGVVAAVVGAMVACGARAEGIRAVVGPSACGRCYEVPAAMRDEVEAAVPATASRTSWGTPALDLPAGVVAQLTRAGVGGIQMHGGCTIEQEVWYSHRGTARGRPGGRMAGVVRLLGERSPTSGPGVS